MPLQQRLSAAAVEHFYFKIYACNGLTTEPFHLSGDLARVGSRG